MGGRPSITSGWSEWGAWYVGYLRNAKAAQTTRLVGMSRKLSRTRSAFLENFELRFKYSDFVSIVLSRVKIVDKFTHKSIDISSRTGLNALARATGTGGSRYRQRMCEPFGLRSTSLICNLIDNL
jgi:hypothetical protein